MLRRLLLVLGLAFTGLTAATPALAQKNEAEFLVLRDNLMDAGRPAQDAVTTSIELLNVVMEAAGQANLTGIDQAWLADWNVRIDAHIATTEAVLPRLGQMSPAEIQRRSMGYPIFSRSLVRANTARATLLESTRQAIFFAKEAKTQAAKAAKGDEQARQRLIRMGVSGTRLTIEAQVVALDSTLADAPADQPHKPFGEATQANSRATIEIYKLMERRLSGQPLDAAGTAARIRVHVAEARRQALLVDPAVQTQLKAVSSGGVAPALLGKLKAVLISYGPSTQTELKIANMMEEAARRIEANADDPGDDAWGFDLTVPLVEKRLADHLARVKMVQNF